MKKTKRSSNTRALKKARAVFAKWLQLDDSTVLDVIAGVIQAHRIPGDPVWMFLVGAPGGAKTEILRAFSGHELVFPLSKFSPKTLVSGFVREEDPSLLPKLDGRVLVVKDFTTVLQMQREARAEIFSTLRDAYDGEVAQSFGTGETKRYSSRFGLIAAVTPAIDDYDALHAQLGERFLKFRVHTVDRLSATHRALQNAGHEEQMRDELQKAARILLVARKPCEAPDWMQEALVNLAEWLAVCRSVVQRDRDSAVKYMPQAEVGTRLVK